MKLSTSPVRCHPERSEGSAFSSGVKSEQKATANVSYRLKHGGSLSSSAGLAGGGGAGLVGGSPLFVAAEPALAGAVPALPAAAGVTGFAADGEVAGLPAAPGLPTVKYLRIFSSRFGPIPRMASKSSTLLNAPYALRICKILSAVAGPIPGTNCNCSAVAVFKFTGAPGGFFFAARPGASRHNAMTAAQTRAAITGQTRAADITVEDTPSMFIYQYIKKGDCKRRSGDHYAPPALYADLALYSCG
jgi:hypothetical protein